MKEFEPTIPPGASCIIQFVWSFDHSLRIKENVGYIILADLCQISIYSSFDHYTTCILMKATLGHILVIHTIMVAESWIFLFTVQSP